MTGPSLPVGRRARGKGRRGGTGPPVPPHALTCGTTFVRFNWGRRTMRSTRPSAPPGRGRRTVLAATGPLTVLALTATACGGSGEDTASGKPDATASQAADGSGDGGIGVPSDVGDRLEEHGIDVDRWEDGAWKDGDKDKWLGESGDFVNPVIE